MAYGIDIFNQSAYEKKRESVKAEPSPGFGSIPNYKQEFEANYSQPNYSENFNKTQSYYDNWMSQHGDYKRSTLDRIFDVLQVGQYASVGAIRERQRAGTSLTPISFNPLDIGKGGIASMTGLIKGLRAANPFGKGYEEGEATTTSVLSEWGWNPESKVGKVARGVIGFAGDVALDPLTYVTGGTGAVIKGTGKGAKIGAKVSKELVKKFGQEVAEEITQKAAQNIGKGLSREAAQKILFEAGESVTTKNVDDFIKRINKFAGIQKNTGQDLMIGIGKNKKLLVDEKTLRMIGDKTIAPYANSIPNLIKNTGIFKKLDTKNALKTLARYDIDQVANTLLANDLRNRHSVKLAKNIVSAKRKMAKIADGLSPDNKLRVLEILDDQELWGKKLVTTGLVDNENGRKLIQRYADELSELDKIINDYDTMIANRKVLEKDADNLTRVISKLEGAKVTNELNKFKELRATFVANQTNIKQALFDINNEPVNQIVGKHIIDYRNKIKTSRIIEETGKSKFVELPYGFRKAGDFIRGADNTTYSLDDFLDSRMNDFSKINNKRGYATSSKSVNKFLGNKHSIDMTREKLLDVIEKTPMLKTDFEMMPLANKVSLEDMNKALDIYANGTADEFFDFSKTLREGYNESRAIAELEFDEAVKGFQDLTGKELADATRKAQADKFRRIDELMLNEDERLPLYIKNIDKSDALARSRKQKFAKGSNYADLKTRRVDLEGRLASGAITDDELLELQELAKELGTRNKRLYDQGIVNKAKLDANELYSTLTDSEIDNILRTDYYGDFKQAQFDEAFDPWEDIDLDSTKATETELFSDSFIDGSDLKKVYGDASTPDWIRRDNVLTDADIDALLATNDDVDKLIDQFNLGSGKGFDIKVSPETERMARLFDQMIDNTSKFDIDMENISDSAQILQSKKFNRAKKIAEEVSKVNKNAGKEFKANFVKNDLLSDLFKQTPEENIASIKNTKVRNAKQRKYAESILDAQKLKAKSYDLTTEQIDNLDKYLKLDFESVVNQLDGIDKKQIRNYKRSVMKKYFPDKRLKDLTRIEKEFIDDQILEAQKTGIIQSVDRKDFYDALLERTDIEIGKMDEISEAIESNAQKTKEGYWMQSDNIKNEISKIDEQLKEFENVRNIDAAKSKADELRKAFRDGKVDDYAKSQLGMAYDQFVNWTEIPDTMLKQNKLLDGDSELIDTVLKLREELNVFQTMEESNKIAAYFPHIVKEKHQKLFNEFVELSEDALVGSDGRPFIANKLSRNWKGSIKDFHNAWDNHLEQFGKAPTFDDLFKNGQPVEVPRDLFENDLVKALTERAIRHENYVFDSKNSKKIAELVSEPYTPKRGLKGTESVVIPREDLIRLAKDLRGIDAAKGVKTKGPITTTEIINHFQNEYLADVLIKPDDLYAEVRGNINKVYSATDEYGKRLFNTRAMKQEVLDHFNQLSAYQKSDGIQKVLDVYDKFLHLWKLNVTVVNPSFHARNAMGNSFNSYLDIGTKAFSFKERKRIANIMSGVSNEIIGGFDAEELIQVAKQLEVIDTGQFGFELRQLMESSKKTNSKWAKFDPSNATNFLPYKAGTQVGSYIENLDKMLNFVHHIESGMNPNLAAEMTNKFLFDYKNATVFEKEVLRRAVPFWTWAKKNIPLQMEMVTKHPEKYRPFIKGLQALDQSNLGDERISFDRKRDAGDFAKDWVTVPGDADGVKIYNPNLPYQDLSLDVKSFIGRLSPFIKVPVELAADYDSYYGTDIDSSLHHILKQLGPYSSGSKLMRKQGTDRRLEILAQLTGLRFLNYDQEKYNYRKIIDELEMENRR